MKTNIDADHGMTAIVRSYNFNEKPCKRTLFSVKKTIAVADELNENSFKL